MVPNESMRCHGVDDCDEAESESDSREPIGLPGIRPVSQPADEFAVLDVVKAFLTRFGSSGKTRHRIRSRRAGHSRVFNRLRV